ncbi:tyrosine-type recombinase/integrase [Kitasatospora kifunensis]
MHRYCNCQAPILTPAGRPVLGANGKPRHYRLGATCPSLANRHHGSWCYDVTLPHLPGAKRERCRASGFSTRREALAAADHLLDTALPLPGPPEVGLTTGDFLRQWLSEKAPGLAPTTARSYEGHLRLHLLPHLDSVPLAELRPHHIADVFDAIDSRNSAISVQRDQYARAHARHQEWKSRYGRNPGHPRANAPAPAVPEPFLPHRPRGAQPRVTSAATKQRIRATLRSALSDARRQLLIPVNWAGLVQLPPVHKPRALLWTPARIAAWEGTGVRPSSVMVWTEEQTGGFLDAVVEDWLYALWHLLTYRGLRRGEAVGLRWSEVDLDLGTIDITRQVIQLGYVPYEATPKQHSERTLALDSGTIEALSTHRSRMRAASRSRGDPWAPGGRVFVRADGSPLHPDYVSKRFRLLCRRSGSPPVRLHDLRHEAATLTLTAVGDRRVVQDLLGHATLATTDDYASVTPARARAAAEAAAALVPRYRSCLPPTLGHRWPRSPCRSRSASGPVARRQFSSRSTRAASLPKPPPRWCRCTRCGRASPLYGWWQRCCCLTRFQVPSLDIRASQEVGRRRRY